MVKEIHPLNDYLDNIIEVIDMEAEMADEAEAVGLCNIFAEFLRISS